MRRYASLQNSPWKNFTGPNLAYLMDVYEQYLMEPESIDPELKSLFDQWGPPSLPSDRTKEIPSQDVEAAIDPMYVNKVVSAMNLAEHIRTYGHLEADVYPFKLDENENNRLDLQAFDISEEDLKQIPAHYILPNTSTPMNNAWEAIQHLKKVYTSRIGFEFHHIHDSEEKRWLQEQVENGSLFPIFSKEERIQLLTRLSEVEGFEKFLHRTFVGQKRFSIEGLDTLVPLLDSIIQSAIDDGVETINIGMAHRGRLNVLAHILEKPYRLLFSEFLHKPNKELISQEDNLNITYGWTGDVKYHLGGTKTINKGDSNIRITVAYNPSHLEVISPVVDGYTRAAQENRKKSGFPTQDVTKAISIAVHGDAAFAGEGIVQETLNMGKLSGYQVGGTIHIIANNNIGFTTEIDDSRSTYYASDIVKGYEIPVIHVNADDPEAVIAAGILAYRYRNKFNKSFLIDLIGYRRYGHNETDDPMVTNPLMYQVINQRPTTKELYSQQLIEMGLMTKEEVENIDNNIYQKLQNEYEIASHTSFQIDEYMETPKEIEENFNVITQVPEDELQLINDALLSWPSDFQVLNKLERILKRREAPFKGEGRIDWAHAEALAFGSILRDGIPIRFTGQDSQRGTFAHRHLVLHDQNTGREYIPLHHIPDAEATFVVYNSPLTEAGVVGFEYGYNVFAPETLVLWEAQFGDFANMAQVYFDQFLSSGRAKWGQKSGLVLLLPHGYEGQGPEHSSARLERFLQSSAENNWIVANLSTAAQYFHLLRRQAATLGKDCVKPLVIMTPKSLLRHPLASVEVKELTEGRFQPVIEQKGTGEYPDLVERIILCSGKIAIELEEQLQKINDIRWLHILRVEELYPFPSKIIESIIHRYPNVKEIVWVQEEPKNMGAWSFVEPYIRELSPKGVEIKYVGRRERSSPSEGDSNLHTLEQNRILKQATTKEVMIDS